MTTNQSRAAKRPPEVTGSSRQIWVAVILLAATIVGIMAGFLADAGGMNPPGAILTGGGAFGTSTLLLLAIAHYVDGGHDHTA